MKRLTLFFVISILLVSCGREASQEGIDRQGNYEFSLAGQNFPGDYTAVADLPSRVQEKAQERETLTGAANGKVHLVVRFKDPLTAKIREQFSNDNVTILTRINPNIWIASANQTGAESLVASQLVDWARLYPLEAKLSGEISIETPFEWQIRPGGRQAYSVLFYGDIEADEVTRLENMPLAVEFENFDEQAFAVVRIVTLVLAPEDLNGLANADIVRWIEPAPPPDIPDNQANVQPLSNVDDVQIAPYNLSGTGITVGVWEAQEIGTNGIVRNTHQNLTGRATLAADQVVPTPAVFSDHATHVAGTIASDGSAAGTGATEGMAPAASIVSWNSASDSNEMTNSANSAGGPGNPTPIDLSNHSYGIGIGWAGNGSSFSSFNNFGQYTNSSLAFDNVVLNTDLMVFKSAGNDRNDVWDGVTAVPPGTPTGTRDCTQGGFGVDADCIGPRGNAKNIITVGAMNGAAAIANFSSFGPTDDGRIKPDIMAQGVGVFSLGNASNTDTATKQGTSMATPAVSGIAALILEEANNLSLDISAAGMKALLLQTAQDVAGVGQATVGPDYATGYGIADAQGAVDLLRLPSGPGLVQETLTATGVVNAYNHPFYVPAGLAEMHVTLAWTDQGGDPTTPSGPQLIEDLDLRLIAPDGVTSFSPWALNPASPGNAAVRNGGDDTVNNVEQVSVLTPAEGVWFAQVSAKAGSLTLGSQDFALAGPLTPASGPITSTKANIMMVMDKSGSMRLPSSTAGLTKLQALQGAANAFVDFIGLVGGHNVGLVQFDSAVRALTPVFDLQPLDSASLPNAHSAINGISWGGNTNIISGVTEGQNQLGSAAATNPEDIVFLFSDGRHNRPIGSDVSDIDTIMDASTDFYAIGFGTDVDSSVMPGVATSHNGLYLEEQTLSAAQLSKMFLLIGGLTVDEDVVIDPDFPLPPGASAQLSFNASAADRALTFVTLWNLDNQNQMEVQIIGPGRQCIVDRSNPNYQTRSGNRYRLIRIKLPVTCADSGEIMHEGTWMVVARNQGDTDDTAKMMVLAESAINLNSAVFVDGSEVLIKASFDKDGVPFCGASNVTAFLTPRLPSTGDSEKQDELGTEFNPQRQEGLTNQLYQTYQDQLAKLPVPRELTFSDSGKEGDERPNDCIFTASLTFPPGSGFLQFRIVASLEIGSLKVTREAYHSVFIK